MGVAHDASMSANAYDAVVIGSGLGGLTAGALLAAEGRKVCVIERNHSLGGAASAFKHGALTIEPALHQTGDPRDPCEIKHDVLKKLGLLDEIEWIPVGSFFTVRGGPFGEPFELPVGFDRARAALTQRFPRSAKGLDQLLTRMETLYSGVADLNRARREHAVRPLLRGALELRSLVGDWRASLDDVFNRCLGDDEAAKFALGGNLGYYSDDPRKMWWPFFAIAQSSFLKSGGVFIKGGSRVLSMKLARVVTRAGGRCCSGAQRSASRPTGPAVSPSCATPIRRNPKTAKRSRQERSSPIAGRTPSPPCWRSRLADASQPPMAGANCRRRCSQPILA